MSIHSYEHTHVHTISMITFERLTDLILKFTKSVTKSVSLSTKISSPTERIINHKYNTYIKSKI
jgi:hypothetical protein